jgi:hypothetical protein
VLQIAASAAVMTFVANLAFNADDEQDQRADPEEYGYGVSQHVTSRPVAWAGDHFQYYIVTR